MFVIHFFIFSSCTAVKKYEETPEQIAMAGFVEGNTEVEYPSLRDTKLDRHLMAGLLRVFKHHTMYLTALVEKVEQALTGRV